MPRLILPPDPGVVQMGLTGNLLDVSTLLRKNAYTITKNQAHVGEATVRMRRTFSPAEYVEHGAFYPTKGMEVRIYNGWGRLLFGGNAYKINWQPLVNSNFSLPAKEIDVLCVDWTRVLSDRVLFAVYENMSVGDIIKDIFNAHLFLPPGADPDTGVILAVHDKFQVKDGDVLSGPTISVVFNGDVVTDALDKLVTASNTDISQYAWWIGVDRDVHYYPIDQTLAPSANFKLSDTNGAVFDDNFKVEETDEKYANEVIVIVSEDAAPSQIDSTIPDTGEGTITPLGDGATQTFDVTLPIQSVRAVTLNGVDATFSVGPEADHPGFEWYFTIGSTEIVQAVDGLPIESTDDLQWEYVPMFANTVSAVSTVEQNARRDIENVSGHHQIIITRDDIKTLGAGQAYADAVLSKVIKPAVRLTFATFKPNESYDFDLTPGMLIDGNISDLLVVNGGPFMIDEVNIDMIEASTDAGPTAQATLYTVSAFGGALLGNYIDFFRALGRGGIATGGVTLGAFDEGFWHIGGIVRTGRNSTVHHQFSRDCAPVFAFASLLSGQPATSMVEIDFVHRPSGASILGATKIVIQAGQTDSVEPVTFSMSSFKSREKAELNVLQAGGAKNMVVYLFSV